MNEDKLYRLFRQERNKQILNEMIDTVIVFVDAEEGGRQARAAYWYLLPFVDSSGDFVKSNLVVWNINNFPERRCFTAWEQYSSEAKFFRSFGS